MPITVKAGANIERKLPPEDNHPARCISIVHIGTVYDEAFQKNKDIVRITWELPLEKAVFKEGEEERPFVVSKDYTLSLGDKATLRIHLENWRGQKFTEKELAGFDLEKLLGTPCMVQVVHGTSKSGDKYASVSSVSKLPKGYSVPEPVNRPFVFDVNDFNKELFDLFPEWLKEKISSTREYKAVFSNTPMDESADDLPF